MASSAIPPWKRIAGRRFQNTITGETISRRQYDKKFGALAKGGFTSYEQKAKASPKKLRLSRPARGRPKLKNLQPLAGHLGRDIVLPVKISFDALGPNFAQAKKYRAKYNEIRQAVIDNKKLFAVSLAIQTTSSAFYTVIRTRYHDECATYDRFLGALSEIDIAYEIQTITQIIFRVRFYEKYVKKSSVKTLLKRRPNAN